MANRTAFPVRQIRLVTVSVLLSFFLAAALCAQDAPDKVPPVFERTKEQFSLDAVINTSDGKSYTGTITGTLGKEMTIFNRQEKRYVDFALSGVARIDVQIEEEREEKEWSWKESGSDEKVYTGKTYPVRKYVTTLTLAEDKKIVGDLSGPIYFTAPDGKEQFFVLRKTQKGDEGQKPSDLIYVKSIVIGDKGDPSPPEAAAEKPPAGDSSEHVAGENPPADAPQENPGEAKD